MASQGVYLYTVSRRHFYRAGLPGNYAFQREDTALAGLPVGKKKKNNEAEKFKLARCLCVFIELNTTGE